MGETGPGKPIPHPPGRQRTRIHLVDVMHGAREVILLHEGQTWHDLLDTCAE
jgi:hypothetical protein